MPSSEQDAEPETDCAVKGEPFGYVYREHDEVTELTREQVQEIRSQVKRHDRFAEVLPPVGLNSWCVDGMSVYLLLVLGKGGGWDCEITLSP